MDYYPDELSLIFEAYADLSTPKEEVEMVYADELW